MYVDWHLFKCTSILLGPLPFLTLAPNRVQDLCWWISILFPLSSSPSLCHRYHLHQFLNYHRCPCLCFTTCVGVHGSRAFLPPPQRWISLHCLSRTSHVCLQSTLFFARRNFSTACQQNLSATLKGTFRASNLKAPTIFNLNKVRGWQKVEEVIIHTLQFQESLV